MFLCLNTSFILHFFLFIASLNALCNDISAHISKLLAFEVSFQILETLQIPPLETELEALMDCPQHAELLEMVNKLKADIELYSPNVSQQKCFAEVFRTRYCK